MPYVACHDCETMVHFKPKNLTEFNKRFVEGNEPIYCINCFKKREKEREKNMNEMMEKAREFAKEAHKNQVRKTTGAPYIGHPFHVAKILEDAGLPPEVVVAGYLHDTVEDTDVTIEDIYREFGSEVGDLVAYNTEEKEHTWEQRKEHTVEQLKTGTVGQKALVVADKYANLLELIRVHEKIGNEVFNAFKRGREQQGWYFSGVAKSGKENLTENEIPAFFYQYEKAVDSFFQ